MDALFVRETEDGFQQVPGYFGTRPQLVDEGTVADLNSILTELQRQIANFNSTGSGFIFAQILKFTVVITRFHPLAGSSYIPTPPWLSAKKCVINTKNNDQQCFVWSVLAALYPQPKNPDRIHRYRKYRDTLNLQGLSFPLEVRDIPKFEQLNPDISINVLTREDDSFYVLYLSPERARSHHINLFLLEDGDKKHYLYIKNMSRLVAGRTTRTAKSFVCNSCLQPFTRKDVLERHIPYCLKHPPQQVRYPSHEDGSATLKFKCKNKQHKLPIYLVADLECILQPVDTDQNASSTYTIVDEHVVSGFACHRVSLMEEHQTPPTVYSGPDVMSKFYEHIMAEHAAISKILGKNVPMQALTFKQQTDYDDATVCQNCNEPFTTNNRKVRHHCHVSGQFLFAACNNCNLQLKLRKKRGASDDVEDDDNDGGGGGDYANEYFLPLVFHNSKCYDSHFVIKSFQKKFVEQQNRNGTISHQDVKVIPLNAEKYLHFQIGGIRFLDSYQFLSASLDELVSCLMKDGKHNFIHTTKFLSDDDLIYKKGVFPYSYMTSRDRFHETSLPPIEAFHDKLKDEPLTRENYERAHEIWSRFGMKNMQQYHDLYLLSDVLLLTDVFEHFRHSVYRQHRLDCLHFITLPSLAWAAALYHTKVELELITDPDIHLLLEGNLKGGIATISKRYASANNPYVEGFDPNLPTTYITYLDANNLYGKAQSEPLPVSGFRFLDERELEDFDVMSISADSEHGYIVECDLTYPPHIHDAHSDYPLAPEHLTITDDMLSEFAKGLFDPRYPWKPSEKLIPNLLDKTKYVAHYRNLQFYINHGLVLTKIHRVITFKQEPWLRPWIDLCTAQRQMAQSDFESDLAKLQANATFGKTMENVRNRQNIRLIADSQKALKAVSKATFRQCEIINDDLLLVRGARQKITLNKPIAVGFTILELSKLIMYRFYYDHLKSKYADRCRLLFNDTDSMCCEIQTANIYDDMARDLSEYDTSNFETDHPLYSNRNHRVLAKFKSETGSLAPSEFVGLKAKMYSLLCDKKSQKKAKGIKKHIVKKHVHHEHYLRVLRQTTPRTSCKFRMFRSRRHTVNTVETVKTCLDAFDDKRFILPDGICTLAYGHYSLRK